MSDSQNQVSRLRTNQPGSSQQNVLEIVRKNPRIAAGVSKLIAPNRTKRPRAMDHNANLATPDSYGIRETSRTLIEDQRDARTLIGMMPDIEMSMNVKTAAILNPRDLTTVELTYAAPETKMDGLLSNGLIDLIRTYFTDVHRITPQLSKILKNAMFLKGAHPIAVIPENTLDALINAPNTASLESEIKPFLSADFNFKLIGQIGPSKHQLKSAHSTTIRTLRSPLQIGTQVSLETYAVNDSSHRALTLYWDEKDPTSKDKVNKRVESDDLITFHDNPNLLKMPLLREKIVKQRIAESYYPEVDLPDFDDEEKIQNQLSTEALAIENQIRKITLDQAESIVYKKRTLETRTAVLAKSQDSTLRVSVSEPLIIDLPYEACFPVITQGEEDKPVAFIILIDRNTGNFVTDRYTDQQLREMAKMHNPGGSSFSSAMISRVDQLLGSDQAGMGATQYYNNHMEYCSRVSGEITEADFVDRIFNGASGRKVSIGDLHNLGRIMLARRFAEQGTEILFLPREIVSYFAFYHRKDGIGESLIEQMKPMLAMRLALMMANLLGELKNSIGRTKIHCTLDEDDADPLETKEKIIDELIRSRQLFANFPTRVQGPGDVLNYLAGAGLEFTWEEHPRLPNIKIDVDYDNTNHSLPSTTLEELYQKRSIWKFGIPPEQIDAALGPDFAVQAINSNVMWAKQILQDQMLFSEQITEHVKRIIRATPSLRGEMIKLVNRNLKHVKFDKITDPETISPNLKRDISIKLVDEFIDGLTTSLPAPNSVTHRNQIEAISDYEELIKKCMAFHISPEFLTEEMVGVNIADRTEMLSASIIAVMMRRFMGQHGIAPELSDLGISTDDTTKFTIYDEQIQQAKLIMAEFTKLLERMQDPKDTINGILDRNTDIGSSTPSTTETTSSETPPPEGMEGFGDDMPSMDETPPEDAIPESEEKPNEEANKDEGAEAGTDNQPNPESGSEEPPAT